MPVELEGGLVLGVMLKPTDTIETIAEELEHFANYPVTPPLETHIEALQIQMQNSADLLRQLSRRSVEKGKDGENGDTR